MGMNAHEARREALEEAGAVGVAKVLTFMGTAALTAAIGCTLAAVGAPPGPPPTWPGGADVLRALTATEPPLEAARYVVSLAGWALVAYLGAVLTGRLAISIASAGGNTRQATAMERVWRAMTVPPLRRLLEGGLAGAVFLSAFVQVVPKPAAPPAAAVEQGHVIGIAPLPTAGLATPAGETYSQGASEVLAGAGGGSQTAAAGPSTGAGLIVAAVEYAGFDDEIPDIVNTFQPSITDPYYDDYLWAFTGTNGLSTPQIPGPPAAPAATPQQSRGSEQVASGAPTAVAAAPGGAIGGGSASGSSSNGTAGAVQVSTAGGGQASAAKGDKDARGGGSAGSAAALSGADGAAVPSLDEILAGANATMQMVNEIRGQFASSPLGQWVRRYLGEKYTWGLGFGMPSTPRDFWAYNPAGFPLSARPWSDAPPSPPAGVDPVVWLNIVYALDYPNALRIAKEGAAQVQRAAQEGGLLGGPLPGQPVDAMGLPILPPGTVDKVHLEIYIPEGRAYAPYGEWPGLQPLMDLFREWGPRIVAYGASRYIAVDVPRQAYEDYVRSGDISQFIRQAPGYGRLTGGGS